MKMTQLEVITRSTVPDHLRLKTAEKLFGYNFPMKLEVSIYGIAGRISEDYNGGFWEFYLLDNGGFYMAPVSDTTYHVTTENYYEGDMSADALGITVCLYCYSRLSFGEGAFARICANQYHLLRDYMLDHPERQAIIAATD